MGWEFSTVAGQDGCGAGGVGLDWRQSRPPATEPSVSVPAQWRILIPIALQNIRWLPKTCSGELPIVNFLTGMETPNQPANGASNRPDL